MKPKRNFLRKALAVLLVPAMLVSLMSFAAFADGVSCIFANSLNTLVEPNTTIIMNKDCVQFVAGEDAFPRRDGCIH